MSTDGRTTGGRGGEVRQQRLPSRTLSWVLALLALCAAAGPARAQDGVRRDTLAAAAPQPYRLQPFIVPGSEVVQRGGAVLDTAAYRIDYRHGLLWIDVPPPGVPEAPYVVAYRTLPFRLQDVYRRRSIAEAPVDSAGRVGEQVVVEEAPRGGAAADPFAGTGLRRSGSITRGIVAGNNRDATLESGLRLQLEGEVVDGVEIQAVLTDENTPILPEGTTQRLDEFDKVYIRIASARGTAQLGDFDLALRGSEFARFTRKLQGATVEAALPDVGGVLGGGRAVVAGATARGIFRSQQIEPVDGVQGPYRLEGAQGEQFILVVPGSETVYLDGVALTRGETNDYVIDYATGEVRFTARHLVTSDRRITVEFQYTTNQFTRTLLGTHVEALVAPRGDGTSRAFLGATFLREADSQDFDDEFGFTAADSALVAGAGDGLALRSGAEPVAFDPEAPFVQYLRATRDADGDGLVDTFFQAIETAPPDTATVYRVRFTRVGPGQGSYVREGRSVNGILYRYRGEGGGEYAPVRILPKPKQQRLFDLHGRIEPVRGLALYGEWATSLNDQNRLSALDAGDDVGEAYLGGVAVAPLRIGRLGTVEADVRRRRTGARFVSFDRTRPVEFGRRWNLGTRTLDATGGVVGGGDETVDEGRLQWHLSPQTRLAAEAGRFTLENAFASTRRALAWTSEEAGWPVTDYELEVIDSEDEPRGEAGTWLRQRGLVRQPLWRGRLVPGVEVEHERRRQRVLGTDSLTSTSFAFVELRPGVAYTGESFEVGGELEWRTEDQWLGGALRDAATAWTLQSRLRYRPSSTLQTDATVGYRLRRFTEPFRVQQQAQNNEAVVLQWNGRAQPFEGAVETSWFYEAQTERTPTLQEIYIQTGPQIGEYVWEDTEVVVDGVVVRPKDGIIQIDEFLPERTPDEGTYARTFVPSDSLQSVISVQARLRVELEPYRLWRGDAARWKRWLASVTTRTTLEVQEKSRDDALARIYLLDLSRFRDPVTTLNGRLRVAQDVLFFRQNPAYGLDLSFNQLRGLSELAAGEEARFLNLWSVEGRWRPVTDWTFRLGTRYEHNRVGNDSLSTRRYDIRTWAMAPEASVRPGRAWQLTGGLDLARKTDAVGDRRATLLKLPVEARYNRVRRLSMNARVEVADVRLTGEAAGLAQFELTDGRGPGRSYLWSAGAQYAVNRYLRASLFYDGRAPADAPVLHTVRMQLSAVF